MSRYVNRRAWNMLIGSVCTGYGGLDAGVTAALGGTSRLAWTADNDPDASAVIAHRMPGIPNLGDIRHIAWKDIQPVDVLCAGFPCQPVSAAGKQKGMADERWLWPHIAEAISRMAARPRLLVLENVPRLLTIDGGAAVSQVIGSLSQLGYVGCYGIYSAAEAGAAHLRKRWFCVAADACSGELQRRGIPGLLGGQASEELCQAHQWQRTGHSAAYSTTEASADALGVGRPSRRSSADRDRTGADHHQVVPNADRSMRERRAGQSVRSEERGKAAERSRLAAFPDPGGLDWQEYEAAVRRWELISGHPVPYPVEPGRNGKHRMTAAFPEWLMGLEPGWVTGVPGLSRSAQIRVIGNGVVPRQAAMATASLLEILRETVSL